MTYRYKLSEEAEWDVYESYIWFQRQKEGLGDIFLATLDAVEEAIVSNPTAYPIRYKKKVSAFVVDRFPYLILYVIEENTVDVISVFDTSQQPSKWKKRIR